MLWSFKLISLGSLESSGELVNIKQPALLVVVSGGEWGMNADL